MTNMTINTTATTVASTPTTNSIGKSGVHLEQASAQWANRPVDERFWDLAEMDTATTKWASECREAKRDLKAMRVEAKDGEVVLVGPQGNPALFSHYAFGQFSARMSAPAGYLRTLPAELAARNLEHSLQVRATSGQETEQANILIHLNGGMRVQAFTSDRYERIWNGQIVKWARSLPEGWRVAPARPTGQDGERVRIATEADCLQNRLEGLGIQPGNRIAPAGLYASDHDCFIFMVNESLTVRTPDGRSLNRGFFLKNSEVGDSALVLTMFLYDAVCGNHIVWNAEGVRELRIRHIGDPAKFARTKVLPMVNQLSQISAAADEDRLRAAFKLSLGKDRDEVVKALYSKDLAPRTTLEAAFDTATKHQHTHGDPRTAWGMASGITRLSQATGYSDRREELDRVGGKILELAW